MAFQERFCAVVAVQRILVPGGYEVHLWWAGRIVLTLCGCFFVFFGIHILVSSFFLEDPFLFMMSFLASTLMILFSAAIVAGLLAQMVRAMRAGDDKKNDNGMHGDH